jgi:hypothetical protein
MTRRLLQFAGVALVTGLVGVAQVPRDGSRVTLERGESIIAGTLVADDANAAPIRRARVTLTELTRSASRIVMTDDAGRFVFVELPAGRYQLTVTKAAWLNASYGATRPGGSGTAIALRSAERMTSLVVKMVRGAVISGTVRDERGQPAAGVTVAVIHPRLRDGEATLPTASPTAVATTDENGEFRAYGLPPGNMVVAALRGGSRASSTADAFRPTSAAEIQRAERGEAIDPTTRPGPVTWAMSFHPNAIDPADAVPIPLAAGEERQGIDITLRLVPVARVKGVVVGPDGAPRAGAQLTLTSMGPRLSGGTGINGLLLTSTDRDGRYEFPAVLPGSYSLVAGATRTPVGQATGEHSDHELTGALYAMTELSMMGQDLDVPLALHPMLTVSGRVVFEGDATTEAGGLIVRLNRVGRPFEGTGGAHTLTPSTTSFTMQGILPGRYQLTLRAPAGSPWVARSSILRGQDSLDVPVEVRPGENVSDWVLTITNRPSELTGVLLDAGGQPAPEYFIVVFSVDRPFWSPPSRRIAQTRPGQDGRFSVKGLPAGEYFIAAISDLDPGQSLDAAVLDRLIPAAARVRVADGQLTSQDLKIGRE